MAPNHQLPEWRSDWGHEKHQQKTISIFFKMRRRGRTEREKKWRGARQPCVFYGNYTAKLIAQALTWPCVISTSIPHPQLERNDVKEIPDDVLLRRATCDTNDSPLISLRTNGFINGETPILCIFPSLSRGSLICSFVVFARIFWLKTDLLS